RPSVLERALPLRREEEVVDRLLGLDAEHAPDVLLADGAVRHQRDPEERALLLAAQEGFEELLLGDEALPDQDLPERLPRVVGPGGVDGAVLEVDPLLHAAPLEVERPRVARGGDPLQALAEVDLPTIPPQPRPITQ